MRKYILYAFLGLLVLLAMGAIFVAMRPGEFAISRSAVVPGTPDKAFAIVNDFHEWNNWSPWAKLDPNCKVVFDGPSPGVGAKFAWAGNNEVGTGNMTIIESKPNDEIRIDLNFLKPMEGKSLTVFTFKSEADGTRITWTMSGKNGFMGKLFGLMMDCDKMVGGQFEQGLENMKKILSEKKKD